MLRQTVEKHTLNFSRLPVLCSLVPIVTAHLCYWLAVEMGHIELCNPYWDGCSSISKTGRQPPEAILFKGLMIPAFVCCGLYWALMRNWLLNLNPQLNSRASWMLWVGIGAALALILYAAALGYHSDLYQALRRIGILGGFACSLVAQILETGMLRQIAATSTDPVLKRVANIKLGLIVFGLLLGVVSVILDATIPGYRDGPEDALEWNFTLLMFLFYLPSYWLWQNCRLELKR